jgi:RNA polymerase sigma-70 factor (ECF subfamily)
MDDAALATRAREGDEEAVEALVRAHLTSVHRLALRLAGDAGAAEDIAQEAFVKAWRNLKKYDPAKPFLPWLLAIARNAALDYLRKKKAVPFSALAASDADGGPSFADTIPDEEPLPDELFGRAELAAQVQDALAKLPERDRTVLALRYEEGLAFEDIGAVMDAPMNTVKSWHRRAQARLRALLMDAPGHG